MQKKSSADVFIRGGQTTQHWFRMGTQVLKNALIFATIFGILTWGVLAVTYYKSENFWLMWAQFQAKFAVENHGNPDHILRYYSPEDGAWVERTAAFVYNDDYAIELSADYEQKAIDFLYLSLIPAGIVMLIVIIVFYASGRNMEGDQHVRGTKLVLESELKKWVRLKWQDYEKRFGKGRKRGPRYTIAGIQFPPNAVEAQTVICGTVGVGKSNAIRELLSTVREMDGKAIVYDRMGTFVEDFYDPSKDIIINPFDQRSHAWSPFNEAHDEEFFSQLAEVFIPDNATTNDKFWVQSARIVFDYAARTLFDRKKTTNRDLREAILQISSEELATLLQATPGAHFFNKDILKTAGSIRANLITELRFLEYLRDDAEQFSVRDWIKDDDRKGFIFLTGDAEHQAATRNIISAIFEVAANALMATQQSTDPRVWFILDEVPTLNKMPFLSKSLAQIRQFGGAFVVGYQVFSQLEEIYGDKGARTIAGNLNNRVIFNTPDADTAEAFSKSLGSEDIEEKRENITVGAHTTRDGVGFMAQRTERRIVTASQIQSLAQFESYISFAYDSPTAFVTFKAFPIAPKALKFIPYIGPNFAKGEMRAASIVEPIDGKSPIVVAQEKINENPSTQDHFEDYLRHLRNRGQSYFADNEAYQEQLYSHFVFHRSKGSKPSDIGLPSFHGPLMAGNAQRQVTTPQNNIVLLKPGHGQEETIETTKPNNNSGLSDIPPSAKKVPSATKPISFSDVAVLAEWNNPSK